MLAWGSSRGGLLASCQRNGQETYISTKGKPSFLLVSLLGLSLDFTSTQMAMMTRRLSSRLIQILRIENLGPSCGASCAITSWSELLCPYHFFDSHFSGYN